MYVADLIVTGIYVCSSMYDGKVNILLLGAFITDKCSDDVVIKQMRSIYARGNALIIRHFKHCSEEVKSLLFKTYCTGCYCSALWCKCKCRIYNKVKVAYIKI